MIDDEFNKLMQFFSEPEEVKEKKIEEVFKHSMMFFEKYKNLLASGNEEERRAIQQKMDLLRQKLREENDKTRAKLGVNSDELKQLANDPKHFTEEQWEFLQRAQTNLQAEQQEQAERLEHTKQERVSKLKEKGKKKPQAKKSGWLKS